MVVPVWAFIVFIPRALRLLDVLEGSLNARVGIYCFYTTL